MTFVVDDPISFAGNVLETVKDAVLAVDENGLVRYVSPAAVRILDCQADDVLGSPIERVLRQPENASEHPVRGCLCDGVARIGQDGAAESSTDNGRPPDYDTVPLRIDGRLAGALVAFNGVTEQQRPTAESVNAQKLEELGRIAGGVAHEINTPTQYVNDNVHFLRDAFEALGDLVRAGERVVECSLQGDSVESAINDLASKTEQSDLRELEQEVPAALEQTLEGLSRINKIAGALRVFLHPATDEKTAADLNRAIENAVAVCRNEWRYVARVELDFDEGMPSVTCWIHEFSQVILNLVINAAHSIADKIAGRPGEMGQITITTRTRGEYAEIKVRDDGVGIPSDLLHAIFAPFFTTKEKGRGTGQGLALAWSVIVDKHGGSIKADSEMGEGAVFTILLPFREVREKEKVELGEPLQGGLVR
jgi:signal transduction histidine kinase